LIGCMFLKNTFPENKNEYYKGISVGTLLVLVG